MNYVKKLNLHGFNYEEARIETIKAIESMWNSDEMIHIITGNSDKMKKVVTDVADEYKLKWWNGDQYNQGYIRIDL